MSVIAPMPINKKESECSCAPCKRFFKAALKEGSECIRQTSSARADGTAVLGNQSGLVRKGDRVVVHGKHAGVVKYVGLADDHIIAPEMHVGVHLYDNVYSTHNGVYKGKRFFFCPRGHGAMVKYSEISQLNPIPQTRPVLGNPMFPSYEAVKKRRKDRQQKIHEAEEKLRKEYEAKRRAQIERYSKSVPSPRISPRSTKASQLRMGQGEEKPRQPLQDEYDIAYRDYLNRQRRNQERLAFSESPEQIQLRQMKKVFGGDEKAQRMAETLRKLHQAYEEGKIVAMAERDTY
ncbi:dynactin subunit 1 [Aplysia californica]|uniref:Dynactin subunit 1 n=1 Tax=Aplysia californica TaxID=6500 RepID=A0ABM0JLE7_APLCA|nr:dynactin subunit 1 [Aplysia californica]